MTETEIVDEWLRRLRDGSVLQTRRKLGDSRTGTRCCLGIPCDIAVEQGIISIIGTDTLGFDGDKYNTDVWYGLNGTNCVCDMPPEEVNELLPSLYENFPAYAAMNDDKGASFVDIAAVIESDYYGTDNSA